ncbi:prolyl aminopeptidase [Magnetovibrio blakemorei]|uniref:Proline iminopeptidase n=1 Tax=Magnetovibrio blakemorei TaxID=28181 RepID=A0A1E5QCG1_9PROT|nr:prolyl aminopeptidase [Magnetovibrio blakemorei]OEJ69699.1 prolyl aminopeptidase [Magnetovibrio blakemorei]
MDSAPNFGLYPPIQPHTTAMLDVGNGHSVYYEVSGNPLGIPVVFVHGGPGAGSVATQRQYFNPEKYCIVLFDQRGAGRSIPYASISHNTTDHLVEDMEMLRGHLNIDQWLVAGGSWGATLALAYGTRHPKSCLGFILRGIFLGTQNEVDWFLGGMGTFFPEHFAAFSDQVGGRTGTDLFETYCERLFSPEPNIHLPAARAWARYESLCSTLLPQARSGGVFQSSPAFNHYALTLARIEAHYFKHNMFLREGELLARVNAIAHLPAIIVQGRYDVVCPIKTAHALHLAWPNSELAVVPDAGHSGMEPGIARALVQAADTMAVNLA